MKSANRIYVKLQQGTLSGIQKKLPNGKPMYAFRGVPYAIPPVGKLRFMAPLPIQKYSDPVLDCSKEGSICMQQELMGTSGIVGSENCLFLNVYSPANDNVNKKLPVMVYFHGGGFQYGSGNKDLFSPEYLVQEDVIVVTCNYRVGPLGFMYLPKGDVNGNAGLLDQLMVLEWINANISLFNGDPDNVTLFGESAGAAAVHVHLLSPISRKYFHKVICHSGCAINEWAYQVEPEDKARNIAKLMGCSSNSDPEIIKFLQGVEASDLVDKIKYVATKDEKFRGLPLIFKLVLNKNEKNVLLESSPLDNMNIKDLYNIPVMMGYNTAEGIFMIQNEKKIKEFNDDLQKTIPSAVNVTMDTPQSRQLAKEIREFYFQGDQFSKTHKLNNLVDLMSDINFVTLINATIELHQQHQKKSPLYYYQFGFDGDFGMLKKIFQLGHLKGVCHADELFYLFGSSLFPTDDSVETKSTQMRQKMCRMWTNFAKYSNPTPDSDAILDTKWVPVDNDSKDKNCLYIGDEIKMIKNPNNDRVEFWKNVYKTWNESFLKPKL